MKAIWTACNCIADRFLPNGKKPEYLHSDEAAVNRWQMYQRNPQVLYYAVHGPKGHLIWLVPDYKNTDVG